MENVAQYIDHTILNADATKEDIRVLCEEAKEYNFKTVCIQPYWVAYAKELLKGTDVGVTTVIGFPLGANTSGIKAAETKVAIADGASDVDMVINIGALKSGDTDIVLEDIKAVVEAAAGEAIVKVIIETSLLTKEEKVRASELSKQAGADFVKTSTGFASAGATIEDVKLMREAVGPELGVKASGGIRTKEDVEAMLDAGASRIGLSRTVEIMSN